MSEQRKARKKKLQKTPHLLSNFLAEKVAFEDISIVYRDDVAGNDVKLNLGEFTADIKDFDLNNQHYVIKSLCLKNTSLKYLQQKPLTRVTGSLTKQHRHSKNRIR